MKFTEIEFAGNDVGTSEVEALLARAKQDVPLLAAEHGKAQASYAKAEAERMRIEKLRGAAQSKAKVLFEKQKEAKRRSLESHTNETEDGPSWKAYRDARDERDKVLSQLSFLTSFSLEDATRACLVAEAVERSAHADHLEGIAVAKRLGLMSLAAAALAEDPGATISLADQNDERGPASMSVKLSREVTRIRTVEIPVLEAKIRDHDRRVKSEQTLVGDQLFA